MIIPEQNIIFFGTPEFAAVILRAAQSWVRVRAVVTQPDKPKGRHRSPLPSPVKLMALSAGIPVLQPDRASDPLFLQSIGNLKPDLILTAAYGQILPKTLLNIPRHGCLNVHASLLPKYRGAAPINWAIINGETETGISIMRMDPGLDTGPVLLQEPVPVLPDDTGVTLTRKLSDKAIDILPGCIQAYIEGKLSPVPQDEEKATFARILRKTDGLMDWSLEAVAIHNRVRGLLPWPAAYTYLGGLQIKILETKVLQGGGEPGTVVDVGKGHLVVAAGQGRISIAALQPAGKGAMPVQAFLQGHEIALGTRFESQAVRQE